MVVAYTLTFELMNFRDSKRKLQITEAEFESKTSSLIQNAIAWNNLDSLNFLNIVKTFKIHFSEKDQLTQQLRNKPISELNKVFVPKDKKWPTCYNFHVSCFDRYQKKCLSKLTRNK